MAEAARGMPTVGRVSLLHTHDVNEEETEEGGGGGRIEGGKGNGLKQVREIRRGRE